MASETIETGGDRLAARAARLPRPVRFIAVGCIGLMSDLCAFTAVLSYMPHPLAVRLVSLGFATLVTWRLNRALTFAPSLRAQHHEAMRYAIVTALSQGTSYAVFVALVLALPGRLPQIALLVGAAVGAFVSYHGHRVFAFAPAVRDIASQGAPRA
ncbi:MAG TPA: GtrA family protein [Xanthobacteraceae bacterium]|nr:GtrA family protein [Xanthobacteraceae bacterium]